MGQTERSPRNIRMMTALLLLATFAVGAASGVGLTIWLADYLTPPQKPPPMLRRLPLEHMSLTQEQWSDIQACIDEHRQELQQIVEGTYPRVSEVNDKIEKEVRALLTPEQLKKLDELKANRPPRRRNPFPRDRRHGPWGKRGGPPFGAPPGNSPPGPADTGNDHPPPPPPPDASL